MSTLGECDPIRPSVSEPIHGVISIVICTRNRARSLSHTLEALSRVAVPEGLRAELVVVDNGSTDHTRRVVESAQLSNVAVRYLYHGNPGKCWAYNLALRVARGDVLLFTDDDVVPPTNWIEGMCRPILKGDADATQGAIRISPELDRPWMDELQRGLLSEFLRVNAEQVASPFLIGANMAFSRRVLTAVPEFDPELGPGARGYGDDTLFGLQLIEAGFRIRFVLDVVVLHAFDRSRLLRRSLLTQAAKAGGTGAYLVHHWGQEPITHPRARLLLNWARLARLRLFRPSARRRVEGVDPDEYTYTSRYHLYRQYLRDRRSPTRYDKRGLLKRGVMAGPTGTSINRTTLEPSFDHHYSDL